MSATKPIFKQMDMKTEMKKADGAEFTHYPTYVFSKSREMYKDRIGQSLPRFVGRRGYK